MRNLFQTDRLANVGPVFDHGYDPAVVEFQKCAQHHQREKLMLGEVLAAEPAGIGRQGGAATSTAFLANATGDRVIGRVVSMPYICGFSPHESIGFQQSQLYCHPHPVICSTA